MDFNKRIRRLLNSELRYFPEAGLMDLYKLFYQDYFGPKHYYSSFKQIEDDILSELEALSKKHSEHKIQEIFCFNRFIRVPISIIPDEISLNRFIELFQQSSLISLHKPVSWKSCWCSIKGIAFAAKRELMNNVRIIESLDSAACKEEAVHHSEKYKKLYSPHYRLIDSSLWSDEPVRF